MNEMMVRADVRADQWYTVGGEGYAKSGAIMGAAGDVAPDFTRLAYGLCLCSDATVSDAGNVIGDPTEAALVVLAAKLGVDAEESRREYPRVAEVPFDSAYKFMATFHNVPSDEGPPPARTGQGGPRRRARPVHGSGDSRGGRADRRPPGFDPGRQPRDV